MAIDLSSKRISKNVVATVSQVLVSGIVFFILYRYLYDHLGIELIGVWSLVLAATSVSRIGELGLSAGVVKYVAQALGQGDEERASDVIQTIALTLAVFMGILIIILYPLFVLGLGYLLPAHGLSAALEILPYALASLWIMVLVSVVSGGLDGSMHMDLRSFLMMGSHIFYLLLVIVLVPTYGLEGVAIAQLIQYSFLLLSLWVALKIKMPLLPFVPSRWSFLLLKDMFVYGVNFQIISIMNMLFDPMVKAMMSKFGGLEALGYYEMANRLVLQGRALIIEASRVMVPAVAALQEKNKESFKSLFSVAYRMSFYVSVLFYALFGIFITTISTLWLGHYQGELIQFSLVLSFGWFINTLIGPAYFSYLGQGNLKVNVISHVIIGLCSFCFGAILGLSYGALGVVIGAAIGLVCGSLFLLVSFFKESGLYRITFILPKGMRKLLSIGFAAVFVSNFGLDYSESTFSAPSIALLCSIPLLLLGWFNPVRLQFLAKCNLFGK